MLANRPLGVLAVLRSPRLLVREALAGLVVALALIPEAISFSVIAGVDPRVGLFSSVVMAIVTCWLLAPVSTLKGLPVLGRSRMRADEVYFSGSPAA